MKSILVIFSILAFVALGATEAQAAVNGIDTFGSKRISAEVAVREYGLKINEWVLARNEQRPGYSRLKKEIESAIQAQYGFGFVSLSLITYFSPLSGQYVTVDVVELEDVSKRMAFLPEPSGQFEDPDGLIAHWKEYNLTGEELRASGQLEYTDSCPAFHCTFGFEHPRLAPYLEKLNQLVPRNEAELVRILKEDVRPEFRGTAAYLLAHSKDGSSIVRYALGSVSDSSFIVRNSAVRVLSEIARRHPKIEIPVEPILQVLNFPETTDRNKAGYTLVSLSLKEKNKKPILCSGGKILLEMLKLVQPNNHDPAYVVLKNISGQDFGERNYPAWENWLNQVDCREDRP